MRKLPISVGESLKNTLLSMATNELDIPVLNVFSPETAIPCFLISAKRMKFSDAWLWAQKFLAKLLMLS